MKLRKMKLINYFFIGTALIGIAILLYVPPISNMKNIDNQTAFWLQQAISENEDTSDLLNSEAASSSGTPTISPTPQFSPTPTPLPVYPLEESGYPSGIDTLIKKYCDAKVTNNTDALQNLSTDPSKVISIDELTESMKDIDDYRNIKCYVKKTYIENLYIVYMYYEIKITNIKTCAPSLKKLYVISDENGDFKILDDEMTETQKAYFNAREEDDDVKALAEVTDKQAKEARDKDEALNNYWRARNQTDGADGR